MSLVVRLVPCKNTDLFHLVYTKRVASVRVPVDEVLPWRESTASKRTVTEHAREKHASPLALKRPSTIGSVKAKTCPCIDDSRAQRTIWRTSLICYPASFLLRSAQVSTSYIYLTMPGLVMPTLSAVPVRKQNPTQRKMQEGRLKKTGASGIMTFLVGWANCPAIPPPLIARRIVCPPWIIQHIADWNTSPLKRWRQKSR